MRLPAASFALALLDPPYAQGPEAALALLSAPLLPARWWSPSTTRGAPPAERYPGLALEDRCDYGSAGVSIYRRE